MMCAVQNPVNQQIVWAFSRIVIRFRRLGRLLALYCLSSLAILAHAAPSEKLIVFWEPSNSANSASIDHSAWQKLLDLHLDDGHTSGINRFNYEGISELERVQLQAYLKDMQAINIRNYRRAEQMAYWINLYNALTVELILDNYPVDTITDLGKKFFSFGPWDDHVATISGQKVTLNDIEHGILRPIWKDNRIHYGVNCASISCPNLLGTAFTAENTDTLLDQAAREYVNHPRGVDLQGDEMIISSIYEWYKVDFGGTNKTLIQHLINYANEPLATQLRQFNGDIDDDYDWDLNEP